MAQPNASPVQIYDPRPHYLNEIALAPTVEPLPVRRLQIASWGEGRRLEWHTLDEHSPIYRWAAEGLAQAAQLNREEG